MSTQTQTQSKSNNIQVETARAKLLEVEKALNSIVIGHEDMVKAIMVATVSGEHVVIVGPPGTAKSYTVYTFARLLNAKYYFYLLTKFTSFDELFGSVDITALTRGEYKRNWSRIVASDFIFLDEIFKANSAILNALLSLLQERVVYDPFTGQPINTAVWTVIGASNETPEDPELQALYDRFAVRVFIDYISDDAMMLKAIQARWVNSNSVTALASMQDVIAMNQYAMSLMCARIKDMGDVWKLYHINVVPLVKSLRSKGILVSDRTIIEKLPKLYCSYLALYGITVDNIMASVFELVKYLTRSRDELREINKAIDDALGEVAELARKLEKAKEMLRARNIHGAKEILLEILNFEPARIEKTPWLKPRVEAIISSAKEYINLIAQIEEQIEKLSKF